MESTKRTNREVSHVIDVVNSTYNEWKKIKRRINAVSIVTTTANRIENISPNIIPEIHEVTKDKLAILIMRCMETPLWETLDKKERIYKKIRAVANKLQDINMATGTEGVLREVIMTRLSASYAYQNKQDGKLVFVSYEPKPTQKYIDYLFGSTEVDKVYNTTILELPERFEDIIDILDKDYEKAFKRFKK